MKRPEGFGGSRPDGAARPAAAPTTAAPYPTGPNPMAQKPMAQKRSTQKPIAQKSSAPKPAAPGPTARSSTSRNPGVPSAPALKPASLERAARAAERSAARARRRAEHEEVRRFTRRSRRRRLVTVAALGSLGALVLAVAVVTLSPLMSLQTVTVVGAQRLDPVAVADSLDRHLGTPLALLDEGGVRDDLSAFPLIRSYTTEVVPPHTLVVRLVERVPLAAIDRGGSIELVDAAGVVVDRSTERPAGIPLIAPESADVASLAFESVTEVLSALPAELRGQVDVIRATTRDDVTFSMTGAGHRVVWGSAERSAFKARVLAAAIATTSQSRAWEYDVSAPETLVVRGL